MSYIVVMQLSELQRKTLANYFVDKPVVRAFLFGSMATENATKNSDVDVLVELDYSLPIGFLFFRMQRELEELLKCPVDLVSAGGLSPFLREEIHATRKLIYAK
jgi:predicted nucleotidyltransferase